MVPAVTRGARIVSGALIAAAVVAVVWLEGRGATTQGGSATPSTSSAGNGPGRALSPTAVLAIDVSHASPRHGLRAQTGPRSPMQAFDAARNLKPLYDSLTAANAPDTAAAKFVRYEILRLCARIDSGNAASEQWSPERRKQLADSIPDALAEKKAKRLAAFDRLAARCEGLEGLTATQAELKALLDAAAQGGDPSARAARIDRDIRAAAPAFHGPHLEEAQFRELRDVLASGDPAAMYMAGMVLSNTYANEVVEVGGRELYGPAAAQAWQLVACDYGMECGPESRYLDYACVTSGWCRAGNVADYTYFYGTTPAGAQVVDQYRRMFQQAVDSGDWSQLQAVPRSSNRLDSVFIAPATPR